MLFEIDNSIKQKKERRKKKMYFYNTYLLTAHKYVNRIHVISTFRNFCCTKQHNTRSLVCKLFLYILNVISIYNHVILSHMHFKCFHCIGCDERVGAISCD